MSAPLVKGKVYWTDAPGDEVLANDIVRQSTKNWPHMYSHPRLGWIFGVQQDGMHSYGVYYAVSPAPVADSGGGYDAIVASRSKHAVDYVHINVESLDDAKAVVTAMRELAE